MNLKFGPSSAGMAHQLGQFDWKLDDTFKIAQSGDRQIDAHCQVGI